MYSCENTQMYHQEFSDENAPVQIKLSLSTIQRLEKNSGMKVVQPPLPPPTNLSVSGASTRKYRCWCHSGRRCPKFVKKEFVQYTQCSYMEICNECGTVFSDVDDVSIPSFGDCSHYVDFQ